MLALNALRKQKLCLSDYDYKQDINNRILMAQFTSRDLAVLQEILYSPLRISARKLAKNCDLPLEETMASLEKFAKGKLVSVNGDMIDVDKSARKYFESEVNKFDPHFQPNMDYLFRLLKKVPIHVLPMWYAIPRTTNNIFESLVERYLLTPQIYQRHLSEVRCYEPMLANLIDEIFHTSEKVKARTLIEKYQLTHEAFEEYLLFLEFHFACFISYEKIGNVWEEMVSPFHEWSEYLKFLQNTEAKPISDVHKIQRLRPKDFSFVEDVRILLQCAKKQPIAFAPQQNYSLPLHERMLDITKQMEAADAEDPKFIAYFKRLVNKAILLKFAEIVDHKFYALDAANAWMDLSPEHRALSCYRHPLNRLIAEEVPLQLCTEKLVREAEKSILRVLRSGWVLFEEFMRGVTIPLNKTSIIILQKKGRTWKYQIPQYSDDEIALLKAVVLDWLFEAGIVAIGKFEEKPSFAVTPFGQSLFG